MAEFFGPSKDVFGFRFQTVVNIDFSQAAWNTVATHEVFDVTGHVRAFCVYVITAGLTSAGAPNLSFGYASGTAEYCTAKAHTAYAANNIVSAGAANPNNRVATANILQASTFQDVLLSERDIGYEITVAAMTGGTIVATCYWMPLVNGSSVAQGAGGAL